MKKILMLASFVIALGMMSFTIISTHEETKTNASEYNSNINLTSITVDEIHQVGPRAFSHSTKTAQIDWDSMTLYIDEGQRKNQPYTVRTNPYKGYDDDDRGVYSYCASNYYFNK